VGAGGRDGLKRHGLAGDAVELVWVPASFEIPLALQRLAGSRQDAPVGLDPVGDGVGHGEGLQGNPPKT